jgi:tRNA-specific 2-thiouridylase
MEKIVLGLSGGVDSAVSAALLMQRGFEVHGVFLDIGLGSPEDARQVAEKLGISFEAVPIAEELSAKVCTPFAVAYLNGRTPNPCIMCNPGVKFPNLLKIADKIGAKYVATGHYARVEIDEECGRARLLKNPSANDQSYMLCMLPQEILKRIVFPLGCMEKSDVRKAAEDLNISVAKKPDSMEICFIPDNDYAAFIEKRFETPPEGNFVDENGKILGKHKGIHHYTVGQRRGLGISAGQRIFVSRIDSEKNEVVLSPEGEGISEIFVKNINWIAFESPENAFKAAVKVRHSRIEYPALIVPSAQGSKVIFDKPIRRPAPGQSAVFYDGDYVLGGGEVEACRNSGIKFH